MIKISALNESSDESEEEELPTITKEAQEQIALTEYNKALELLRENKYENALNIFKDLLETELLDEVEKPDIPDGRTRPMLSLKYSCFKNIGLIHTNLRNYEDAIDSYWEAANLDDTDVTLWYKIGNLATKVYNLELACIAFKQGLKCNPNHWPCLDSIITILYAVPDYMNCLLYISMAFEQDPYYLKGLVFRDKIFKDIPSLEDCYKVYNKNWELDPPLYTEFDESIGNKLMAEAKEISDRWAEFSKKEFKAMPLENLALRKSINHYTWLEVGLSLLDMHKYISENNLNFASCINLTVNQSDKTNQNTEHCREPQCDDIEMVGHVSNDLENDNKDHNKFILNEEPDDSVDISNANQLFTNNLSTSTKMEVNEDKKSNSSDIEMIEEDPLKLSDSEILQIDKQNDSQIMEIGNDNVLSQESNTEQPESEKVIDVLYQSQNNETNSEKINDKNNSKENEKVSHKDDDESIIKIEEKSNEKIEGKDDGHKVKRRRRSAVCMLHEWAWSDSSMRRSARVRGSNRREAERDDVQLEETLKRIFPSSLLPDIVNSTKDDPSKSIDYSMDTMDLYQLFAEHENKNNSIEGAKSSDSSKSSSPVPDQPCYFGSEMENMDVEEFLFKHNGNSNLMIVIAKFTEFLSKMWQLKWPRELIDIYLQIYLLTREHIPHSSPFEEKTDDSLLQLDVEMALLFGELHTDKYLNTKPEKVGSSTLEKFNTGFPAEELGFIIFTSIRQDLTKNENIFLLLRVLWLKANIFLCQNDIDIVIETLDLLLHHIQDIENHSHKINVKLPNCNYNSVVSAKIVEKKLTSIQRSQKLGEIQNLYEQKKYAELALILQDTFKFAKQKHKLLPTLDKPIVPREKQLEMLMNSLWQLQWYEDCYIWSEACLNEAWQNYCNTPDDDVEQKKWTTSVVYALEKLEFCTIEVSTFVVKYLPESRLSRLVKNLVQMVCHQLDVPETTIEMPLETVLPWILLHYILQFEEDKERAKSEAYNKSKTQDSSYSESDDEDDGIPSSIMVLFTAHEFIGKHSWCCFNDAKLLFFIMNLIIPKLDTPQYLSIRSKITKYLEQVIYCLYGHPNRVNKTRPKYPEDHHVPQMDLTWEGAQLIFSFYKPKKLPDFQSPRPSSISADTETLLKRIIKLVPQDSNPVLISTEMTNYIIGDVDKMPSVKTPLPHSISAIYYLIGDYNFKNSKWEQATKYYLLDLCLYPLGIDSWAGLAMATGTIMENLLNSYKPISEDRFLVKGKIAQSSYQHAIELAPDNSVIWPEYGNFVYMIHSFCSRTLKQESDTLNLERFEILETRKEEMLELADHCFQSANRLFFACQGTKDSSQLHDERWLYLYMLGKVAEKKNKEPPIFLEYYSQASELLYENKAEYPSRINHKNPQNLAIEALEVHYRIHASILKYLEQHEGKRIKKSLGKLFEQHLKNCANGPFMKYQSKLNEKKGDDRMSNKIYNKDEETISETDKKIPPMSHGFSNSEMAQATGKTNSLMDANKYLAQPNNCKKRSADESLIIDNKRIKLSSISHLELMQDVVALIDNLISEVCDKAEKEERVDDVMIIDNDDNNDITSQEIKIKEEENDKSRLSPENCRDNVKSISKVMVKNNDMQDIMDELMKQAMENNQETQNSLQEDDDTRKSDGKWLRKEDLLSSDKEIKDNNGEKKKISLSGNNKEELMLSRRGSQESTTTTQTTTTTETNNSSSSSSDDSSSSEDTSDSDSSSDSDSESADTDTEKKKKETDAPEKDDYMTEEEVSTLIAYCLAGLEQCVLRFPEHYKSFYRLAYFYFNNKAAKDTAKCRELLLENYKCQFYLGQSFPGLFVEKKSNNFFNRIWHIPNREIDRPGSFASHMSKCVTLLMQVLKEMNDSKMLMLLCLQLQKVPDPEKKYLRDSEREQLSRQALALCLQSLRSRVQSMGPPNNMDSMYQIKIDSRTQVLLDVYKIYQQVQKHFQNKDTTMQSFSSLLCDTYKTYVGNKNLEGNILEMAIKCCQRQKASINTISNSSIPTQTTSPSPVIATQVQTISTSPQTTQNRKTNKTLSSGRPRGRPPNSNKYLQQSMNSSLFNQMNMKNYANYMTAAGNQNLLNPFLNPLMDPNMISALLANRMMDSLSAMSFMNQMGYQDILRNYQNLSSLTNMASNLNTAATSSNSTPTISTAGSSLNMSTSLGNLSNMANISSSTFQPLLNVNSTINSTSSRPGNQTSTNSTKTTASITKDRPNISITPVGSSASKNKISKSQAESMLMNIPKSIQISATSKPHQNQPPSQVSLLKPSVLPPAIVKPVSKPVITQQMRVPKALTEPQITYNPSILHSPLKSSTPSNQPIPQIAHVNSGLTIKPAATTMNLPVTSPGTSLQHKLLSKKNSQRPYPQPTVPSNVRKQKPAKSTMLPNNYPNLLSGISQTMSLQQPPFIPSELSGISVSPITQQVKAQKKPLKHPKLPTYEKSLKKINTVDKPAAITNSFPQTSSAEALSMISQLQQHSHLEIIPQQKNIPKSNADYSKNHAGTSIVDQKLADPIRAATADPVGYYNLSRNKPTSATNKKNEKSLKDSVEIITLDD